MCDACRATCRGGNGDPAGQLSGAWQRQFVEVAAIFPEECRYVLEMLGEVYRNDAEAREQVCRRSDRLRFHQQHSGPMMKNCTAGWTRSSRSARRSPTRGWARRSPICCGTGEPLTLFLRHAGTPLDNNIVERALKRAILHRKNALFYHTLNGAQVGDLFMSLIHTCELCGANSFDYLMELLRHSQQLAANPWSGCPGTTGKAWSGLAYDDSCVAEKIRLG